MLIVKRIVNKPVPSNCFVLYDKAVNSDCIIVDPGTEGNEELLKYILEQELSPVYIILTHEHFDHCWGVNDLVKKYNIPIVCTELCSESIKCEKRNCSVFYDNKKSFVVTSQTISVESLNYVLPFAGTGLRFFASPGHSDASVCFTVGKNLFTGDTLLKDVRTVTKITTGSKKKLELTIESFNEMRGDGLIICPGHGEVFRLDEYDINKAL